MGDNASGSRLRPFFGPYLEKLKALGKIVQLPLKKSAMKGRLIRHSVSLAPPLLNPGSAPA